MTKLRVLGDNKWRNSGEYKSESLSIICRNQFSILALLKSKKLLKPAF